MLSRRNCAARECPQLAPDPSAPPPLPIVDAPSREVGATATFSCPEGTGLRGSRVITCQETGRWSDPPARCTKTQCQHPDVPFSVKVIGARKQTYRMGDMLQYSCDTGFLLDGSQVAVCQDSGFWTAPPPKCTTL
ncbi:hypothetical protein LAZ67_8000501 [Cordylochernes scorpioides]|uniref:Sushi domain-containing protein n=1 Tax=Cordylochernes scorpioides TaxID=51811 RepID=A0ABY6KPY7_9ARAC|nr:hypothetical protein LAZ67_8000501 [Cordylochernes scorpioides]